MHLNNEWEPLKPWREERVTLGWGWPRTCHGKGRTREVAYVIKVNRNSYLGGTVAQVWHFDATGADAADDVWVTPARIPFWWRIAVPYAGGSERFSPETGVYFIHSFWRHMWKPQTSEVVKACPAILWKRGSNAYKNDLQNLQLP